MVTFTPFSNQKITTTTHHQKKEQKQTKISMEYICLPISELLLGIVYYFSG
jgi:hypothetical protein